MFPVLVFIGAALAGSKVVSTCVTASVATTVAGKMRRAKEASDTDVNLNFEEQLATRRRERILNLLPAELKKRAQEQWKQDLKLIRQGNVDMVHLPIDERAGLPRELRHMRGTYLLTLRDEMLLYFIMLREQSRLKAGMVGELLRELSERSGIPYEKIDGVLFGDAELNEAMQPLVETLRAISIARLKDQKIRARLEMAQNERAA